MANVLPSRIPSDPVELPVAFHWPTAAVAAGLAVFLLGGVTALTVLSAGSAAPAPDVEVAAAPEVVRVQPPPTPRPTARHTEPPPPVVVVAPDPSPEPVVATSPPAPQRPVAAPVVAAVPAPPDPVPAPGPIQKVPVAAARPPSVVRWYEQPTESDLLLDLERHAVDVDLNRAPDTSTKLMEAAKKAPRVREKGAPRKEWGASVLDLLKDRPDLSGLPMRKETECTLEAETAEEMSQVSLKMRRFQSKLPPVFRTGSRDAIGDYDPYRPSEGRNSQLNDFLGKQERWLREETIPTLVQMLQAEDVPVRLNLVGRMASIKGPQTSLALARRAVFDLSPEVRQAAMDALKSRPRDEYRQTLLDGFRYPWPPVANNAALAVMTLNDRGAVESLAALLDQPDPSAPRISESGKAVISEVVKVNHLRNCLLCHAPSFDDKDPVRGFVPTPGERLPIEYYARGEGAFVRADVTFLKQDFSLMLAVKKPDKWPDVQRFDYMVRTRQLTNQELEDHLALDAERGGKSPTYPQREAVLFTLRQLTGANPGDTTEDWRKYLREIWKGREP